MIRCAHCRELLTEEDVIVGGGYCIYCGCWATIEGD